MHELRFGRIVITFAVVSVHRPLSKCELLKFCFFIVKPIIRNASLLYHNDCIHVRWNKENTGSCKVKYYIQSENNSEVFTTYHNEYHQCNESAKKLNYVKIWAVYGYRKSEIVTLLSQQNRNHGEFFYFISVLIELLFT